MWRLNPLIWCHIIMQHLLMSSDGDYNPFQNQLSPHTFGPCVVAFDKLGIHTISDPFQKWCWWRTCRQLASAHIVFWLLTQSIYQTFGRVMHLWKEIIPIQSCLFTQSAYVNRNDNTMDLTVALSSTFVIYFHSRTHKPTPL